jgi:8-oxo-dGTP pyrophosphatase MutT (NUDIX family)
VSDSDHSSSDWVEVERQASRLLVLSAAGRALLLRLEPGFRPPFWVTPGGGLDDGESFEEAAARELREEVGRDDLPLGPCIWHRRVVFPWERWLVRQEERTFLVPCEGEFEPVVAQPNEEPIVGGAWFGVEELRALEEVAHPEGLAGHLTGLQLHGPPATPLWLGDFTEAPWE